MRDCSIIPVEFDENALRYIAPAINEIAHLYSHVLAWNCQDYTPHIISTVQKEVIVNELNIVDMRNYESRTLTMPLMH